MKKLQEIRIKVLELSEEIEIYPEFEKQFEKIQEYLNRIKEKDTPEDLNYRAINPNRFEEDVLKCTICNALGISESSIWGRAFYIDKIESYAGYHGSGECNYKITYSLVINNSVEYKIPNLLNLTEEKLSFLTNFKDEYSKFKNKLEDIMKNCFPIELTI